MLDGITTDRKDRSWATELRKGINSIQFHQSTFKMDQIQLVATIDLSAAFPFKSIHVS
jgi:hypothetical protein